MKEIGGYFGLEQLQGRAYHEELTAVNNGRNALVYLIRARGIRKLYLPYFLCSSVSDVCAREGCETAFYPIGPDFLPRFAGALGEREWLYAVNYYGQLSNGKIGEMKDRWGRIIVDNVQAFFQKPVTGVDTVYSCRKFFGVPDGGYVFAPGAPEITMETDISMDRMKHILGRFETEASQYYGDFKANDLSFRDLPLRRMSRLTQNLMAGIDYAAVREKRNANYRLLEAALGDRNPLALQMPDGPYAYPFYCKDGMELKKQLAQKKIYVATLWPNVLQLEAGLEKEYAENILPLPCDQRYDSEDMLRLITELEDSMG